MCYKRDFFSTFSDLQGSVLMGNDQSCQIEGVGSVKIEMFDGVVRTLENVRFIPELRKNLISLGTLDARGFHYRVSSGVMDVLAGEKVILRATK